MNNKFTVLNNSITWHTTAFVITGNDRWTQLTWDKQMTHDDIEWYILPEHYRKCHECILDLCNKYDELPKPLVSDAQDIARANRGNMLYTKLVSYRDHYKDFFEYVKDKANMTQNINAIMNEFRIVPQESKIKDRKESIEKDYKRLKELNK